MCCLLRAVWPFLSLNRADKGWGLKGGCQSGSTSSGCHDAVSQRVRCQEALAAWQFLSERGLRVLLAARHNDTGLMAAVVASSILIIVSPTTKGNLGGC